MNVCGETHVHACAHTATRTDTRTETVDDRALARTPRVESFWPKPCTYCALCTIYRDASGAPRLKPSL